MLDTVPVRNVRGLGGKLGEAVVAWSKAETASDLKVFREMRQKVIVARPSRFLWLAVGWHKKAFSPVAAAAGLAYTEPRATVSLVCRNDGRMG